MWFRILRDQKPKSKSSNTIEQMYVHVEMTVQEKLTWTKAWAFRTRGIHQ